MKEKEKIKFIPESEHDGIELELAQHFKSKNGDAYICKKKNEYYLEEMGGIRGPYASLEAAKTGLILKLIDDLLDCLSQHWRKENGIS